MWLFFQLVPGPISWRFGEGFMAGAAIPPGPAAPHPAAPLLLPFAQFTPILQIPAVAFGHCSLSSDPAPSISSRQPSRAAQLPHPWLPLFSQALLHPIPSPQPLHKCMINRQRDQAHTNPQSRPQPSTALQGNLAPAQVFSINIFNLAKAPHTDNHMISHVSWKGIHRSQIIN